MTDIPTLIKAVQAYAKRAGFKDSTASLWVFNDSRRLAALQDGSATITVKRLRESIDLVARLESELARGIKCNPWPAIVKTRARAKAREGAKKARADRQAVSA